MDAGRFKLEMQAAYEQGQKVFNDRRAANAQHAARVLNDTLERINIAAGIVGYERSEESWIVGGEWKVRREDQTVFVSYQMRNLRAQEATLTFTYDSRTSPALSVKGLDADAQKAVERERPTSGIISSLRSQFSDTVGVEDDKVPLLPDAVGEMLVRFFGP